jgi:HD superfamily phosphodiesterase
MDVVPAVARHAEEVMGPEGFHYVSAIVANCKMLAYELESEQTEPTGLDIEVLVIAAYLHDISIASQGLEDHQVESAAMAVDFLRTLSIPSEMVQKVEQAILSHTQVVAVEQRSDGITEGQILYDATKLGRLGGVAVVTSLIEFGARYPNRAMNGEVLAAVLRHIEERFVELYQSLYTEAAKTMAREKFNNTLAFLDGVIEHLSDATPV